MELEGPSRQRELPEVLESKGCLRSNRKFRGVWGRLDRNEK